MFVLILTMTVIVALGRVSLEQFGARFWSGTAIPEISDLTHPSHPRTGSSIFVQILRIVLNIFYVNSSLLVHRGIILILPSLKFYNSQHKVNIKYDEAALCSLHMSLHFAV